MIGGRTPEELETLLEDAILLGDADASVFCWPDEIRHSQSPTAASH